jgi:transcriptional regulator with XRE-family HTH domain
MMKVIGTRVKEIWKFRKLKGKDLANLAGISPAEVAHIEGGSRNPGIDITERLAGVLEVTLDYLAGKEDSELPLSEALSRQSLRIFQRDGNLTLEQEQFTRRLAERESAPRTVKEWANLIDNIAFWNATQK